MCEIRKDNWFLQVYIKFCFPFHQFYIIHLYLKSSQFVVCFILLQTKQNKISTQYWLFFIPLSLE